MITVLRVVLATALSVIASGAPAALPEGRPPTHFFPVDLDVYPQNFAIVADSRGRFYLGGDGVLIFDGDRWEHVPVSNDDIVRSLAVAGNDRIYVGGYDAFGYLEPLPTGRFAYTELSGLFSEDLKDEPFADIWNVLVTTEAIYFVGLEHLFRYDPENGRTGFWRHEDSFGPVFGYQGRVYLHFRGEGIKVYDNGDWTLIDAPDFSETFLDSAVVSGEELLLLRSDGPWLRFDGQSFTPLQESLALPIPGSATRAVAIGDGRLAVATSVGSVLFLDLSDWSSTVVKLSPGYIPDATRGPGGELLFVDDQGFYAIRWPTPWRVVDGGLTGTVHQFELVDDRLYVLTSGGIFSRGADNAQFEALDWTRDEAWALLPLDSGDLLFADSYEITLRRADGTVEMIDDSTTGREFLRSRYDPDLVWVGTELGIQVLLRDGDSWRSVYRNDEMDNLRVADIVELGPDELLISSMRGGVRRLRFERGERWQMTQRQYGPGEGLSYGEEDSSAQLISISGDLHASTTEGFYRWQDGRFSRVSLSGLAEALPPDRDPWLVENDGELWAYTFDELYRLEDSWRRMNASGLAPGVLNRVRFLGDRLVIGTLGALLTVETGDHASTPAPAPLNLTSAVAFRSAQDGAGRPLPLDAIVLSGRDERLTLRYVLADLQGRNRVRYRTRLLPLEANFSPYSDDAQQSFVTLGPGDYELQIEARDSRGQTAALSVPIIVEPLWHERPAVRSAAGLLLLAAVFTLASINARRRSTRLQQERDHLESMVAARTGELAEANERLQHMANLDSLTQLPNRRRLDDYLRDTWQQSAERQRSVAIALIDVDHFKQYNDSFGHRAGDELLVAFAALLSRHLRRAEDLVARYGGEEFLAVFPGADLDTAREVVESMREAVMQAELNVTLSAGIHALVPDASLRLEDMIAAADTALYAAKSRGRNRVVSARESEAAAPDAS